MATLVPTLTLKSSDAFSDVIDFTITDLLGRPSEEGGNKLLFYIYDDGTVEKKIKQN